MKSICISNNCFSSVLSISQHLCTASFMTREGPIYRVFTSVQKLMYFKALSPTQKIKKKCKKEEKNVKK